MSCSGSDKRQNRAGVTARYSFDFEPRQPLRVTGDAALGAAERDVHDGTLPGHPCGQRLHFVECDVGVVADAALGRSPDSAVLYPVCFEALDVSVVHANRHADRKRSFRVFDHLPRVEIQLQRVSGQVEILHGQFVRVSFFHCCRYQDKTLLGYCRLSPSKAWRHLI